MKKEKILDTAEKLFEEKGFDATSVRELAHAAGVNVAMISYYFGSKDNLLADLIKRRSDSSRIMLEEVNRKQDLSAIEKLDRIIDYYVEMIFSNRKFYHMAYRELNLQQRKGLHQRIMEMISRNWEEIRKTLDNGSRSRLFKEDLDQELIIMTVFGTINQCSRPEILMRLARSDSHAAEQGIKIRLKKHLKNLLHDHIIA